MASIRDVAKMAGISVGTVSRYLNGQQLKEKNIKKVTETISTLDYKENVTAKGLKNNRSFSIGLLTNEISGRFGSEVVSRIERVAEENRYNLLLSGFANQPEETEQKIEYLMKHVIDGLTVFLSEEEWSGFGMLTKMSIPVITSNCPEGPAGIGTILANDRESVTRVIAHHGEQGHKKVGFIAATQIDYVTRERLARAKKTIQSDPSIQLEVFTGDYSRKSGYYGVKELLKKGATAIFVSNYNMLIGAIECFNQEGIRIEKDIAFSHYDYLDKDDLSILPKITITPPTDKIGEQTAEQLLKQIEEEEEENEKVIMMENIIHGIN